ncbi:hypothetical protein ACE1CI_22295 [Aerosakkonemataceae cyanobacterium BLCC-F50]|uniref:Cytochrome P450 n=1 Tax=Floridaenema flaviceps BLCC-F50 TaxID=3153642 RepID=A0ABV4XV93_9CYAN
MTPTHNLPNGPKMPVFLRLIKFVTQPVNYIEDLSKIYGDTFTVWGRNNTPIVYFSQPQALQEIFTTAPDRL